MTMKNLIHIKDGRRTLYYQPLPDVRDDGVAAILVGYRKNGRDHWYN